MNRRAFLRSIPKGVLAAAAAVYSPRLLLPLEPEPMTLLEAARQMDPDPWFRLTFADPDGKSTAAHRWLEMVEKALAAQVPRPPVTMTEVVMRQEEAALYGPAQSLEIYGRGP